LKNFSIFSLFLLAVFFTVNSSKLTEISENNYINEISANGIYQLFSAYRNNQIDFDKLYASEKLKDAIFDIKFLNTLYTLTTY
ncbi:MAG: hypothetical protein RLZZ143_3715, partial [Cyanobacteriota bacterium]